MISVRCRSCGRRYDYAKDDCCPGCGAYNRPPKRELVDADGTVRHLSDAEFDEQAHAALGKVCFEEKECYEEKSCYEYEARPEAMQKRERPAGIKKNGVLALGFAIAIICATMVAFNIVGSVSREPEPYFFDGYTVFNEPFFDESDMTVDERWEVDESDTDFVAQDGSTFRVLDCRREEGAITVELEAEFTDSDHEFYATLECLGENGYLIPLKAFEAEEGDGTTVLHFLTEDDALTPQTFVLEEWSRDSSELISTTRIALTPAGL